MAVKKNEKPIKQPLAAKGKVSHSPKTTQMADVGIRSSVANMSKGTDRKVTKRKRTGKVLEEKQRLNELLLDSLPHIAMLIRKDRTVLAANRLARDAGAKVGGYCWGDFGRSDFIPEEDKKYIDEHKKAPAGGTCCYFCLADKALRSQEPARNPELNAWGKIWDAHWIPLNKETYLHYAIDITEYKQAERDLLFKTTILEAQSETSIDGILVVDREGKSILLNKRFGEMWHIPQQLLDTKDDKIMLQYVLGQLEEPNKFLGKVEYLYTHENEKSRDEIKFKDGKVFDRYSSPLIDSRGIYNGRIWYFRDITERKRKEKEYSTIIQTALDGFWISDTNGRLVDANDSICQILGYSREELLVKSVSDIEVTETKEEIAEHVEKVIKGGYGRFETKHRCKDGRIVDVEVSANYLDVANGQFFVFVRDITERKKAEEELREYRQHLEELVRVRTAELTETNERLLQEIERGKGLEKEILNVSDREQRRVGRELHDSVGQQLTGIAFMTKALEQKLAAKSPDEAADLTQINKLVKEAMEQARDLAKGLHPVDLDAGGLVSSLGELAESTQKLFGIRCTFKCDRPVELKNTEVAVHLYRMTQEAITNAIKHGKAKNIQMALAYGKNESTLTVKSDGLDFPKAPKARGTGMGLQIMGHRAEIIGGSLDIRKAAGGGTIVICRFPNPNR